MWRSEQARSFLTMTATPTPLAEHSRFITTHPVRATRRLARTPSKPIPQATPIPLLVMLRSFLTPPAVTTRQLVLPRFFSIVAAKAPLWAALRSLATLLPKATQPWGLRHSWRTPQGVRWRQFWDFLRLVLTRLSVPTHWKAMSTAAAILP